MIARRSSSPWGVWFGECITAGRRSKTILAGQLRRLPDPIRHEFFVERIALVDVEVTYFLLLGLDGGCGRSAVPRKNATLTYFVMQWKPRNQPDLQCRRKAGSTGRPWFGSDTTRLSS
jgi:hypothetical protein